MWTRAEGHALIVAMATKTKAAADGHAIPPAGRLLKGGVRFYGWAPDPARPGTHRLSVHERDPRAGQRTDRDLDRWFGSYEEAEALVARLNMAARPEGPPAGPREEIRRLLAVPTEAAVSEVFAHAVAIADALCLRLSDLATNAVSALLREAAIELGHEVRR